MSSDKEQKMKIIEDAIASIEKTYGKGWEKQSYGFPIVYTDHRHIIDWN